MPLTIFSALQTHRHKITSATEVSTTKSQSYHYYLIRNLQNYAVSRPLFYLLSAYTHSTLHECTAVYLNLSMCAFTPMHRLFMYVSLCVRVRNCTRMRGEEAAREICPRTQLRRPGVRSPATEYPPAPPLGTFGYSGSLRFNAGKHSNIRVNSIIYW